MSYSYVAPSQSEIFLSTSVSLFSVSSNPGVSTKTTLLPSKSNGAVAAMTSVHDRRPSLVGRPEFDTRLMN